MRRKPVKFCTASLRISDLEPTIDMKRPSLKYAEHFLTILLLILVAFLLYHHVLHGEFVSDDHVNIVESKAIRNPFEPLRIWRGMNTRFLVGWTFSWNYFFGKLNPFGYHVVNVLIHVLNAFLVYCLTILTLSTPILKQQHFSRSNRGIPLLAALLFLCHPVQTQGVSFIFQRSAALAAFFYLLTLVCYALARTTEQKKYIFCALSAMAAGVFCKENMLTLPLALLGFDRFFWPPGIRDRGATVKMIKRVVPFVLLAALIPLILILDNGGANFQFKDQLASRSFSIRYFLTEANVLVTYLRLFIFPVNLMHDYDYPIVQSLFELRTILSLIVLAVILGVGLRLYKRDRLTSFCIFWFFLTTSVEAGVVCFVNRGVIFEHWLYLPMVGLAMLAASLLVRFVKSARLFRIVCAVVLCLLCVLTYQRNFVWQNEIVFWKDNLRKAPNNARVCFAAGTAYFRKGMLDEAEHVFAKALKLNDPGGGQAGQLDVELASDSLNNMGMVRLKKGHLSQAAAAFRAALDVWPHNAQAHNNLGVYLLGQGHWAKAREHFQKSMRIQGDYAHAWYYLGQVALLEGKAPEAKDQLQKAIRLFELDGDAVMARETSRILEEIR